MLFDFVVPFVLLVCLLWAGANHPVTVAAVLPMLFSALRPMIAQATLRSMKELDAAELGSWPRESLYALVPTMDAVDKALSENATNGRSAIKALRSLLAGVAKDDVVVITHGREKRAIPEKWFAELVFQTRNTELANAGNLVRLQSRGIDTVKISAVNDSGKCGSYGGKVFSISGRHKKFPPLAGLIATGAVSHVACRAMFLAYIEGLKR